MDILNKMNKQAMNFRASSLDKHRGFAVIIMIIFHGAYDLNLFGFIQLDFTQGFWYWFPRFIAFNFLFCVGISLQKAYQKKIIWPKFWKRFLKIATAALLISLMTYLLFPRNWVYFGTLHCIALSSLLGLLFVNRPWLAFIGSFAIIIFVEISGMGVEYQTELIGQASMDFIPLVPWFFAVLWGMSYEMKTPQALNFIWDKMPRFLELLGKKALVIYLVHQPFLYGVTYLLYKALN